MDHLEAAQLIDSPIGIALEIHHPSPLHHGLGELVAFGEALHELFKHGARSREDFLLFRRLRQQRCLTLKAGAELEHGIRGLRAIGAGINKRFQVLDHGLEGFVQLACRDGIVSLGRCQPQLAIGELIRHHSQRPYTFGHGNRLKEGFYLFQISLAVIGQGHAVAGQVDLGKLRIRINEALVALDDNIGPLRHLTLAVSARELFFCLLQAEIGIFRTAE